MQKYAREFSGYETSLSDQVVSVAQQVAANKLKVDPSLVIGITAVAFMTIRQAGLPAFEAAPGKMLIDKKACAEVAG